MRAKYRVNIILAIIIFVCLISLVLVFVAKDKVRFDMSSGDSWKEKYVVGFRVKSSKVNSNLKNYAISYGLIDNDNPTILINLDKNFLIMKQTSYSKRKGIYYDLVSTAKNLENSEITDDWYLDEKNKFIRLWNDLLMY